MEVGSLEEHRRQPDSRCRVPPSQRGAAAFASPVTDANAATPEGGDMATAMRSPAPVRVPYIAEASSPRFPCPKCRDGRLQLKKDTLTHAYSKEMEKLDWSEHHPTEQVGRFVCL